LIAVLALDQITKVCVIRYLVNGETIQVIGQFFQLKLIYNTGGALGTELGSSAFYLVSSFLILGFVIYFIMAYRQIKPMSYPLAAIAGGAIGNIIDRLRLGKVVDFLDVDFFDISILGFDIERWWVFNVADSAITVGIIILLIYIIFFSKKHMAKLKSDSETAMESVENS
jgi:signal peptidase II